MLGLDHQFPKKIKFYNSSLQKYMLTEMINNRLQYFKVMKLEQN